MISLRHILVTSFLTIFFLGNVSSQHIPREQGQVKIEMQKFKYKRNWKYEISKRKDKVEYYKYYFDTTGLVTEKITYGKHHDHNLNLIDNVECFYYDPNGKLLKTEDWVTDYSKNIELKMYTDYKYNSKNNKISRTTYNYPKDSFFLNTNYEYNDNGYLSKISNYQTIINYYDSLGNLSQRKMLWDNDSKTNWVITYSYNDSSIIQDFESYYDDHIKDYSRKLNEFYIDGKLIQIQEYYVDKDGMNEITMINYEENGLIKKVDLLQYCCGNKVPEKAGYIEFNAKCTIQLSKGCIDLINAELIYDFVNNFVLQKPPHGKLPSRN